MIGVDPGGHWTGVVARPRRDHKSPCLYAAVVTREPGQELVDYLLEVLDTIAHARTLDRGAQAGEIAVEDAKAPTGWNAQGDRQPIDPKGIIDAARILGGIEGRYPNRHLVPPGGHGALPLTHYPTLLRGPRERKGTGVRRHARSAWDVAGWALCHPDPHKADPGRVTPPPSKGPRP